MENENRRLNLGSGEQAIPGYENWDIANGQSVYPLLGVADGSCAEVRASHVLEHFPHKETFAVLQEWVRALRPGGVLKIAVPDFRYIAEAYLASKEDLPLLGYVMGGQVDEYDFHKTVFDREGLIAAFQALGLEEIGDWKSEIQDCASLPVSLNLKGRKPIRYPVSVDRAEPRKEVEIPKSLSDVIALFSIPRLCFSETMHCALGVFGELGIRTQRHSGVFWGQSLETLLEEAVAGGFRYALTCDYDSLFTTQDVTTLYRLAEESGVPAIAALQMRREKNSPLFCVDVIEGEKEIQIAREAFEEDLFPVATAHFGLTLLRLDAFSSLSKPWFHSRANDDGRWDVGKQDEDIRFWHKWREAGNALCLAPRVVIGHLEMMASWPDKQLQVAHQYASEYTQAGKPDWAWR